MKKRLVIAGALVSASLMLTGCITVEVPAVEETTSSPRPTPSGTTFEAEPAETADSEPIETTQEDAGSGEVLNQAVDFSISGGCQDTYEDAEFYGIFEEFEDDCFLIVEVFPKQPRRFAELQYFDETWVTEASGFTDSEGILYLEVDTICEDGYWCDGIWDYRIAVEGQGVLEAERSVTFELEFIPR